MNAAQGNTKDMEAVLTIVFRKECCKGCSEARRPSRPASRIQYSGAIVTSQSWNELTGGYAHYRLFLIRLRLEKHIRALQNFKLFSFKSYCRSENHFLIYRIMSASAHRHEKAGQATYAACLAPAPSRCVISLQSCLLLRVGHLNNQCGILHAYNCSRRSIF